jgi:hydrogenase maturation protease
LDLRSRLEGSLAAPVCIVGLGNAELGDDAFGVRLAQVIQAAGHPNVIIAGTAPELWVGRIARGGFRSVVFLDAVDFPGEPGSAILIDAAAIKSRFPQVSTHKICIGALASVIESQSEARVWLLGAKPFSLRPAPVLSETLARTLEILKDLLIDALAGSAPRVTSREGDLATKP